MPIDITIYGTLIFLFFAIVLGFGFAIGGSLWGALVGSVRRGRAP